MFERFKNRGTTSDGASGATATATADERGTRTAPVEERTATRPRAGTTRETMQDVRARQREEFGGINWGAAFFGWLVAVGVAVLLTGLLAAAGAAIGLTEPASGAPDATLSLTGAIVLLAVLALAYYCGGYVAGRMSRFDGARQGFGVWLFGLVVTLLVAAAGAILGDRARDAAVRRSRRHRRRPLPSQGRPCGLRRLRLWVRQR